MYVHLDAEGGWLTGRPRLPGHLVAKLTCAGTVQPLWQAGRGAGQCGAGVADRAGADPPVGAGPGPGVPLSRVCGAGASGGASRGPLGRRRPEGVSDRLCKCVTLILGRWTVRKGHVMSDVTDTSDVGRRRREPQEPGPVVDAALAQELVEQAREQGVELLGEHGLLRAMTKAVLERGLAEELTEHLGYEPHERTEVGQHPQRQHPQAVGDRGRRGGPGGAPGPGGLVRAAAGPQGPAPPRWHRQDRDRALRPWDDGA